MPTLPPTVGWVSNPPPRSPPYRHHRAAHRRAAVRRSNLRTAALYGIQTPPSPRTSRPRHPIRRTEGASPHKSQTVRPNHPAPPSTEPRIAGPRCGDPTSEQQHFMESKPLPTPSVAPTTPKSPDRGGLSAQTPNCPPQTTLPPAQSRASPGRGAATHPQNSSTLWNPNPSQPPSVAPTTPKSPDRGGGPAMRGGLRP